MLGAATGGLGDVDADALVDSYARLGLAELSDDRLFDLLAATLAEPRAVPADSFVLHAPLELLARRALLGLVDPAQREVARQRLVWIAAEYRRAAPPLEASDRGASFDTPAQAVARLAALVDDGDVDGVDPVARWLAAHAEATDLAPLGPTIVDRLSAAAHGNIYLYLLPRVAPRSRPALAMLRPLARELARQPDWKIRWFDEPRPRIRPAGATLEEAVLATPRLGLPGSDFIYPLMHQVDANGVAAGVLGPVDPTDGARVLLRIAAWSMLHDDPDRAPYGWTHCLTLPQAASRVAPTARGLAVAATHVVGFRAGLSTTAIGAGYAPDPMTDDPVDALDGPPDWAAAAVHGASPSSLERVVRALATNAACHSDAHVAKYTLACFDAAHADPDHDRLYLSAAAYLAAWWAAHPVNDPLLG